MVEKINPGQYRLLNHDESVFEWCRCL